MTAREALRSALGDLATHKLRSALTMLGMIFGVGAVIAMLSIGAGADSCCATYQSIPASAGWRVRVSPCNSSATCAASVPVTSTSTTSWSSNSRNASVSPSG